MGLDHPKPQVTRVGCAVLGLLDARYQSEAINRRSRCGCVRGCPVLSLHFSPAAGPQVGERTSCICLSLPGPYHPPERTSSTTCAVVGQHERVRQSTAAKKE